MWLVVFVLLCGMTTSISSQTHASELESLVEALRSDDVRLNAKEALKRLRGMIKDRPGMRLEIQSHLENVLDAEDRQIRQAASILLAELYEVQETPHSHWPAAMVDNLVDGLRDDEIQGSDLISNASYALGALYDACPSDS